MKFGSRLGFAWLRFLTRRETGVGIPAARDASNRLRFVIWDIGPRFGVCLGAPTANTVTVQASSYFGTFEAPTGCGAEVHVVPGTLFLDERAQRCSIEPRSEGYTSGICRRESTNEERE